MYDMLPFPNINGVTTEEIVFQINTYLTQFKETLEFILNDISVENLSPELVTKLNDLGANVEKTTEENQDQLSQMSNKMLTTSDIVNSPSFQVALNTKIGNIKFNVNFNTGNLEYTIS